MSDGGLVKAKAVIQMYSELIKRLRASCESCKLWDGYKCCLKGECSAQKSLQAADAIEELKQITTHYEEESKGWWLAACDAKEERERLKEQIPKWIPVTERLPDEGETVLIFSKTHKTILFDWIRNNEWLCFGNASHWMPLPQPPKDGET